MKKECNVVMLPTENKANLFLTGNKLEYKESFTEHGQKNLTKMLNSCNSFAQHLYFTSNDEIKEGDWYIVFYNQGNPAVTKSIGERIDSRCKKIIATTDESLWEIPNSVPGFNFPDRLGLPHIPTSFIKAYVEANGKIDTVSVEMEEIDGFGNTKHFITNYREYQLKLRPDNTVIVHQSKTYTRAEMVSALYSVTKEMYQELIKRGADMSKITDDFDFNADKWIEKNL